MKRVLEEADEIKLCAAQNGEWGDGGAHVLKEQVKFYIHGRKNELPPEWEGYSKQINREEDPDYKLYLILKEKFE